MPEHGDQILLEAGRVLAGLAKPMSQTAVRAFAAAAVDQAAGLQVDGEDLRLTALCGMIQPELSARGALRHHIELVGRAALFMVDFTDNSFSLTQARRLLGSMWAGVLIIEH